MDLTLVRTFLAVAEHRSFAAAAQAIGTVQSNVTARIARLEAQFDQRLFERGRGGASLTPFGAVARDRLADLHNRALTVERELRDLSGAAGALRLGAMETTAAVRLPALMVRLRAACPDAALSLETGPTRHLTRRVWDRSLDAALVAGPVDEARFRAVDAFHETLVLAHAAAARREDAMILFGHGCTYRAMADSWARHVGRVDLPVIEMGSVDAILGCVAAGMGFTILPQSAVARVVATGEVAVEPLPADLRRVTTSLIFRHDHAPVGPARALVGLLEEVGA